MDCSEFLSRFSEYYDDRIELPVRRRMDAHLDGCPSCRRYLEVVDRGVHTLRSSSGRDGVGRNPAPVPQRLRAVLSAPLPELEKETASGSGRWIAAAALVLIGASAWHSSGRDGVDPALQSQSSPVEVERSFERHSPGISIDALLPSRPTVTPRASASFTNQFVGSPSAYSNADFIFPFDLDPVRLNRVE